MILILATPYLEKNDALIDQKLSSYSRINKEKSINTPSSKLVPPSPSVSKVGYIHQVYMSEEDFNMFAQKGQISFHEGKPHFQRKIQ